ncbi:MAG TPA: carbohydrate-binding family 9-like protein, partial [Kofleriaceae bacterium]|nr:carbohydrate-binding family 9-like protein [Kofleriaceae bacterium]
MRVVLLAAVALAGCVDHGPGPQPRKVDPAFVKAHLLAAEPADLERLDVTLGGKVVYLGNRIDQTRVAPGQAVTITHYWKVLAPVGDRWRVFTLVRAPAGSADFMNLDPTDMQHAYGPAKWKAGDVIEDPQTFVVRPDWRSARATILVGLIEVGRHGTLDRMAASGPRTQDRAVVARVLEIDTSRAPPPPGTVHLPRASGEIVIDGVANEPAWATAASSPELATAEGSAEPKGKATAKLLWDDEHLYVFASILDTDIYSEFTQHDDPLWKADCVELFIDADGNRRGYVELQVSPNNVTFDSWFAGPRSARGDEAWDSGMKSAVKVNGTANVKGDGDRGWDVEIAVPLAAVKGRDEAMGVRIPPAIGDRWRLNLVRIDRRSNGEIASVASWNRIGMSDFHALDRMLTVVFADAAGSIVPQAAPAPGAP